MNKKILLISLAFVVAVSSPVLSQSSSSNYSIEESFIGPGGLIDASSASYSLRASLGDTGIGNAVGNLYQLFAGYTTTAEEVLEIIVTGADIDLGILDTTCSATNTGFGTFTVRSYLAQGYSVTSSGDTPTNAFGDTIDAMTTQGACTVDSEQFGFNLVANTSPASIGAGPNQIPDSTFSFGAVASQYGTPNQYKYVEGETIASSNSSSGVTQYTVSYVMNRAALTESGEYVMAHSIIATPTF